MSELLQQGCHCETLGEISKAFSHKPADVQMEGTSPMGGLTKPVVINGSGVVERLMVWAWLERQSAIDAWAVNKEAQQAVHWRGYRYSHQLKARNPRSSRVCI